MYQGWRYVYVAHADPASKMIQLFSPLARKQIDTLVLVAGSMAGLNALLYAKSKAVLFYDVNEQMLRHSKMLVSVISISSSRVDFLSRMYARALHEPFTADSSLVQLARPIDAAIVADTRKRLSLDARCLYDHCLPIWMSNPLSRNRSEYTPRRVCERIVPHFKSTESPYLDPTDLTPRGKLHTCSWYYGHGWLESEASFATVRDRLRRVKAGFMVYDVGELNEMATMLATVRSQSGHRPSSLDVYVSNIFGYFRRAEVGALRRHAAGLGISSNFLSIERTGALINIGRFPPGWNGPARQNSTGLRAGMLRPSFQNRCPKSHRYGSQPHVQAWKALQSMLQASARCAVDVAGSASGGGGTSAAGLSHPRMADWRRDGSVRSGGGPPPPPATTVLEVARRVPWGFYELRALTNRTNLPVSAFLGGTLPAASYDVIILHILVGEGGTREEWGRALAKAWRHAGTVVVLEHNRDSQDWVEGHCHPHGKSNQAGAGCYPMGLTSISQLFTPDELLAATTKVIAPTLPAGAKTYEHVYSCHCLGANEDVRNVYVVLSKCGGARAVRGPYDRFGAVRNLVAVGSE